MTKHLRKTIIHCSSLKKVFNKNTTHKTSDTYKNSQRNFCVNLLRKTNNQYFENINIKDINDKKLWKTIKPFFSSKGLNTSKLVLINDSHLISEEPVLTDTINQYFTNSIKQLHVKNLPN